MTVLIANNVSSALAAPITAAATSMTVTDGSRFPVLTPGQYFYATIIATSGIVEIVKVITRTGNAMSITRAQDGTNAQAFASGARVEMRINAASVRETVTDQTGPLDTRLTTAEGDITALEGRMTTAEGDITALEAFDTALATSSGSTSVGFLQAGTSATLRTVQSKLRDTVSVKDFGAVGNGIADDTVAVQAALNSQQPLDWGGLTYRITATVSRTYTSDLYWEGRNATIIYDGTHVERAVLLQGAGIEVVINNLTIDGGKLCNKCLEVLNNTTTYSRLTCNNVFVTRAKRSIIFNGGDGLWVRGAFTEFLFFGGGASDCELPLGQGVPYSVGVSGISVSFYSASSYVQSMYISGAKIEKIYSSDLTYTVDQDGVRYFSPDDGTTKIRSLFTAVACDFINCYGRSIKTQCRNTTVQSCSFTRNEGFTSGIGNVEVDSQTGNGNFRDLTFSYSNSQVPEVCLNVSGGVGNGTPGLLADGCAVYLSGATLPTFASVFPRNSIYSRHILSNNKVFGSVQQFFEFYCNGDKNYAELSNNYVGEITDGSTSEKALAYVKASVIPPYFAYITAHGNIYAGSFTAALVRDALLNISMSSSLSAWNNFGFVNNLSTGSNSNGLKTNQVARLGRITSGADSGAYFEPVQKLIASGATATYDVANDVGALLFVQARSGSTAYALISSTATTNTSIAVGSAFAVGNTTNPGTGTLNIWSSGTRQISIQNTTAAAHYVTIFVFSP